VLQPAGRPDGSRHARGGRERALQQTPGGPRALRVGQRAAHELRAQQGRGHAPERRGDQERLPRGVDGRGTGRQEAGRQPLDRRRPPRPGERLGRASGAAAAALGREAPVDEVHADGQPRPAGERPQAEEGRPRLVVVALGERSLDGRAVLRGELEHELVPGARQLRGPTAAGGGALDQRGVDQDRDRHPREACEPVDRLAQRRPGGQVVQVGAVALAQELEPLLELRAAGEGLLEPGRPGVHELPQRREPEPGQLGVRLAREQERQVEVAPVGAEGARHAPAHLGVALGGGRRELGEVPAVQARDQPALGAPARVRERGGELLERGREPLVGRRAGGVGGEGEEREGREDHGIKLAGPERRVARAPTVGRRRETSGRGRPGHAVPTRRRAATLSPRSPPCSTA